MGNLFQYILSIPLFICPSAWNESNKQTKDFHYSFSNWNFLTLHPTLNYILYFATETINCILWQHSDIIPRGRKIIRTQILYLDLSAKMECSRRYLLVAPDIYLENRDCLNLILPVFIPKNNKINLPRDGLILNQRQYIVCLIVP